MIRVKQFGITDASGREGEVVVSASKGGYGPPTVDVAWFCGDTRVFRPEDVEGVVANVDAFESMPDVWLKQPDSATNYAFLRLANGDLEAENSISGDARKVNWGELRQAMLDCAAQLTSEPEPEPEPAEDAVAT